MTSTAHTASMAMNFYEIASFFMTTIGPDAVNAPPPHTSGGMLPLKHRSC